ncbi:MAG TPA: response regulator [Xanthomonadaceae bacterium]|nr:response regulator [Xanthomonadaceae bacterium]
MSTQITRHITSDAPHIMVVDGSKVVRRLLEQLLKRELPAVTVIACESGAEAQAKVNEGVIDFVTTALQLPDMDGLELAHYIREHAPQAYVPIVVVSGEVNDRLLNRGFSDEVTDYFDKSLGMEALATFIRGYVHPEDQVTGDVLYVEDSRVVALATRRMLEKHGLKVHHVVSAEDALEFLKTARAEGRAPGADVVLTDVYLKGGLTGKDLLQSVRGEFRYNRGQLPVLVMTADDNPTNQAALIQVGANDLVQKPIEERLLITKLTFQLRVGRLRRRGKSAA